MRTAFFAVAVSLAALAGPAMALAADQGQVFNASRYNVVITVFIRPGWQDGCFQPGNHQESLASCRHADTDRLTFKLSREAKCSFEK